jgi:hypothetical protein
MKKLISLLVAEALAITGCATMPKNISSQKPEEMFRLLGIPEKFAGYEKTSVYPNFYFSQEGKKFFLLDYSDGKILVRESREITQIFPDGFEAEENPKAYVFDLNGNFIFEEDEVLIDEKADGINGNEVWWRDINPENAKYKL